MTETRAAARTRAPRFRLPRRPRLLGPLGLLVVAALVLVWLTVPGDERQDRDDRGADACRPLAVTGWQPDRRTTGEFTRYGNDNTRLDDWTGGDGSRSVRLPDGRTLWLSADTFLDRVHGGRSRDERPVWVRNAALVMDEDGRLERTVLGAGPGALFPGLAAADGREVWRWPVQAVVEPRTPGAEEQVVRVLLWQREAGSGEWVYGVPRATEVATLSLPDLAVESITPVDTPEDADPARRVLYGTAAVRSGGWTYVFGADEGTARGGASGAHVARVPPGRLADPSAWRWWDGSRWQREAARSAELPVGPDEARGASNTYTVVRRGGTWLLLTTDAGGPDGRGLTTVTSYWSCSPQGPWRGPSDVLEPPLPPGGEAAGAAPYNPQAHPALDAPDGGDPPRELVLSYDVNVPESVAAVQRDVALYRPRFVRLELGRPGE
ncbi:hypothetical protein QNO07_22505 [Streptomyces sp. 549]|uniref:DUF4185 domain-containing protein n=1 Tax=Streptomyces sp. 549 TaxID=3049076 RepID=UPI0024C3FBE3|nr:DUF4185 domain-containing protein [Streptomyces sp. 549]MDK1476156.1 hypothetical protein [Streptomyces sp. 549]